jgi:non-ribosomal peptide synthetase-like protein
MTNAKMYKDLFGDSSYIVHFLLALGYDLGKVEQTGSNFGPEVAHETPYLSSVGSGTMVSDGLNIMNADFSSSSFRVSRVSIGERNFLGNDITFPLAARTGDNCLLATKVMVPINGPIREGVGLLGSPPFEIPRIVDRDKEFDELKNEAIRKPLIKAKNKHNIVTMGLFLFVRWFLFFEATLLAAIAVTFYDEFGALAVGVATLAFLVVGILISVVAERSVLGFGRLKPQYCSIYDPYFWHHERLWKLLAVAPFSGTPFKSMIWRLLGVRVGKRLYDAGCDIPEKTLVAIGDDCALNEGTAIQSHSMEDGTFKSDYITLHDRCSLGVESFVNYGVTMHSGSTLLADSFLMKGEEVPENTLYGGNPAREIRDRSVYLPSRVPLPRVPRHRTTGWIGPMRPTRHHRTNPGKHAGIPA